MYLCELTCVTDTDGSETTLRTRARIEEDGKKIRLQYTDGEAVATICFEGKSAFIEREGEYTLTLPLKEGETTQGALGILGSIGEFPVTTNRVEYLWRNKKLMARLSYTLLMSGEQQNMKVRLTTSFVRESEE